VFTNLIKVEFVLIDFQKECCRIFKLTSAAFNLSWFFGKLGFSYTSPWIFVAAKLTEIIKKEMLEGFSQGKSLTSISKEYGCTPTTVTRAVKSFLTEEEFLDLKNNRIKSRNLNLNVNNTISQHKQSLRNSVLNDIGNNTTVGTQDKIKSDLPDVNNIGVENSLTSNDSEFFTEIIPLDIEPFSEEQKEVACKPLDSDTLPNTVFMLITKNNELESKPLKDFSDWSFLPEKDQNRLAIPLFSTHREAKCTCSRNQKVLKVPNSNVFLISLPHLNSKGITRLIIDESLISLDS